MKMWLMAVSAIGIFGVLLTNNPSKMASKSVIKQVRNYYMNGNVGAENFTVISAFDRDKTTGIEEVAIVFVDKPNNQIRKGVTSAQGRLIHEMPLSFCGPIVDMLRHEKPILARFTYQEGPKPFFENFDIFTMREEVGEEES